CLEEILHLDEFFESQATHALTGSIQHMRFVTFLRVTRSISMPRWSCSGMKTTSSSSPLVGCGEGSEFVRCRSAGKELVLRWPDRLRRRSSEDDCFGNCFQWCNRGSSVSVLCVAMGGGDVESGMVKTNGICGSEKARSRSAKSSEATGVGGMTTRVGALIT